MTTTKMVGWEANIAPAQDDPYTPLRERRLKKNEACLIFDGRLLAYRCFHVHHQLQSNDGTPTGALYGMLGVIQATCEVANTNRFLILLDGSQSLRYKRSVFPGYKSRHDRQRTPEELVEHERRNAAINFAFTTLRLFGFPMAKLNELEADDLAGVVIDRARTLGLSWSRIVLCSDDKDWYQLIAPGVDVWRGTQSQYVDLAEFRSRFGFEPDRFADWKAFVGEPNTGDNIPGVKGIGEKIATQFIATHGTWREAHAHAVRVTQGQVQGAKPLQRDYLVAKAHDALEVSYKLSRSIRSVAEAKSLGIKIPVSDVVQLDRDIEYADKVPRPFSVSRLTKFIGEYQFDSLDPRALAASCGFTFSLKG